MAFPCVPCAGRGENLVQAVPAGPQGIRSGLRGKLVDASL